MNLAALDQLLNQLPVIVRGMHPVSLAYLNDPVKIYSSLHELAWILDSPQLTPPFRSLSFDNDPNYASRFPTVDVEHDPFTSDLNRILFDQYAFIAKYLLTQDQVADRIVSTKKLHHVETVVFVLLDGLSYADCRDWPGVEPCLAALPTITRVCFPTIIGSPTLAVRLFSEGLTKRVGFTYWERQNEPLTARLFHTITDTRRLDPIAPNVFDQVVDWLSTNDTKGTYVQIIRSAMDDYAEGHRTTIPRQAVINQIRDDLERIADILKHKGYPAILFAIADHGILWKGDNHRIEVIDFAGVRYSEGLSGAGRGRVFEEDGKSYWVLDYPQMGRSWKSNEQGVHGGISYQESIVPFIQWKVNTSC